MTISPTQQAFVRQKNNLESAVHALKTLETKRNALLMQCDETSRRLVKLRTSVDEEMRTYNKSLAMAKAAMSPKGVQQALLYQALDDTNYPYGFAQTFGELDGALDAMAKIRPDMLVLEREENALQVLSEQLRQIKCHADMLEHVTIPNLRANIKYIAMKLEENDRLAQIRTQRSHIWQDPFC